MFGKIGLIFNGVWSQYAMATAPKYSQIYELIYVHELSDTQLAGFDALVIPFQSHQAAIEQQQKVLYRFLASDRKIAVFGDSTPGWIDAQWEHHPVFRGLLPRHACWHTHGCYTRLPDQAEVIQRNGDNETITWQTTQHGGTLFVSTLDPIVEHGIQQIRHLDHFVYNLTAWLCGTRPSGPFTVPRSAYALNRWPATPN